jgi:hypothetical protein
MQRQRRLWLWLWWLQHIVGTEDGDLGTAFQLIPLAGCFL